MFFCSSICFCETHMYDGFESILMFKRNLSELWPKKRKSDPHMDILSHFELQNGQFQAYLEETALKEGLIISKSNEISALSRFCVTRRSIVNKKGRNSLFWVHYPKYTKTYREHKNIFTNKKTYLNTKKHKICFCVSQWLVNWWHKNIFCVFM